MLSYEAMRDMVQDCSLNFLLGSGLSTPYLQTLGNIESLLTQLEARQSLSQEAATMVRASLYKRYFDGVLLRNPRILEPDAEVRPVLDNYCSFLKAISAILINRKSPILNKEVNLFTTNVDIFLEKALEDLEAEYNDGFNGRFRPSYSPVQFKKSHFKKSRHYDNMSEIPVFNLLKLHGSLTWRIHRPGQIVLSPDLKEVLEISKKADAASSHLASLSQDTIDDLVAAAGATKLDDTVKAFVGAYESLLIVNPTKDKFRQTVLNDTYYDLLRIYSNELEKENSLLFAMGFSFADEHIRQLTIRAADVNPTLMIYVLAYDEDARASIAARFPASSIRNGNLRVIAPPPTQPRVPGQTTETVRFDLPTINKTFFEGLAEGKRESVPPASASTDAPAT